MDQRAQDVATELAKAAPPVSVGAMTLAGIPLSDWVLLLTCTYTFIQLYILWRDKLGGAAWLRRLRTWLGGGL